MRILVTGSAGHLGRTLVPRLRASGDEVVPFDLADGGDVRDADAVRDAAAGVDLVVHTAALHGIHLADHQPREFLDLNVGGTFNVWEAAVEARARGVVFSSTMGVYGESRVPASDDAVAILDEDAELRPGDVYGWSKVVGEALCRYHLAAHGIPSIALRFGMFVPEPFLREGIRYLYGGVHVDDVAGAVIAAIAALGDGTPRHEAFNVEAPLAFGADDGPDLRVDPLRALERRYPGSASLLRERGVTSLKPVTELFPTTRLEERLGFRPKHDVATWLAELERRPDERATTVPPWP